MEVNSLHSWKLNWKLKRTIVFLLITVSSCTECLTSCAKRITSCWQSQLNFLHRVLNFLREAHNFLLAKPA